MMASQSDQAKKTALKEDFPERSLSDDENGKPSLALPCHQA